MPWKLMKGLDVGKVHTHPSGSLMAGPNDIPNMVLTKGFPGWRGDYIMTTNGIRSFQYTGGNWNIQTYTGKTFNTLLETSFWKYLF